MRSIDIINVAGLLIDGRNDGIEDAVRTIVQPRFIKTLAPTPPGSFHEHPNIAIERLIHMIDETVAEIQREFGESRVTLVGRSLGGLYALLAALRMQFRDIFRMVSLEAPLHPDVSVTPPTLLPPLMACGIHYKTRPTLAREAVNRLRELGTSRLLIVQGGSQDSVVPTAAQVIPGDFETIELSGDNFPVQTGNGTRGLVVKLPPHIGGCDDGMKKLLPPGYRNHLFWSDEKMETILRII